MRDFEKVMCIVMAVVCLFLTGCEGGQAYREPDGRIYYIDHELLMLVPVPIVCEGKNAHEKARFLADKLIEGQDFNRKIKRQIPDLKNGISVSVKEKTAYVNLSGEFVDKHPDGRVAERLTVYQIVNTLTSIDGIDSVLFTIENKTEKKFKGFLDMREMYFPKMPVY